MCPIRTWSVGLLALGALACSSPETAQPAGFSWPEASPESRGVDSAKLAALIEQIDAQGIPVHQLTFVVDGAVITRATFFPYSAQSLHDVASVTKSVTATLVGVALDRGYLADVHQRVAPLFPDRVIAGLDKRKRAIRLADLLSMTSGFDCGFAPGEAELFAMQAASDWIGYALDLPMRDTPGSRFAYCSCNSHLLSAITTDATGKTLLAFAEEALFGPLEIRSVAWPADPDGYSHGWGDLELMPDDLAKLGQLYLHGGSWNGVGLVSPDWIAAAHTPVIAADASDDYGLGFWIPHAPAGMYLAQGRGGQTLGVWPDKRLVVVMLAGGATLGSLAPFLLAALQPDPLPENPDAQARLAQAIAHAALPPDPEPIAPPPAIAASVSGRKYVLAANALGLTWLTLDFVAPNEGVLTFARAGETHALRIGLDGVPRLSDNRLGLPAALVGHWEGDTFEMVFDEVALINRFAFSFAFAGEGVTIHIEELASGLFAPETFTGSAALD